MGGYSQNYHRALTLPDGTPVIVRAVRPDDKPLLADGFAHLSEQSRFRRFLHHKARLSAAELRFFTEVDGHDHYALGILAHRDGASVPMAIGRLVRSASMNRDTAEIAVVVMDEFQGRGVGRLLLTELAAAAHERDIVKLQFTLMLDNDPMRRLIHAVLGPDRVVEQDGPVVTLEADVPSTLQHPVAHLRRAQGLAWRRNIAATQRLTAAMSRPLSSPRS